MPCQAHLSVEHYEAEKAAGIQRESLRSVSPSCAFAKKSVLI